MRCVYCGANAGDKYFCPICGADLTLPRRLIRISNLLYNKGLEKAQVRDLSGAIYVLRRSLKFNNENIDARNLLGLCYFETGEVVSALVEWVISNNFNRGTNLAESYIKVLQSNKNRLDQYNEAIRKYNKSLDYCRQGYDDVALMQLRKVISKNPKFVRAYQLLSLVYMRHGNWEKARILLNRALRIDNTNTTTLRYLTEIEETTGKISVFGRRKRMYQDILTAQDKWEDKPFGSLPYTSGNNNIIITPSTFRDSSSIATFINIMLGIMLGAAIVWFLTVPSIRQSANDKANKSVSEANTSLATITATVQDLQDQVDEANANTDTAKAEAQNANDLVESYTALLKVADLYVRGDQTKTIEALEKLEADDYDGEGRQLFDDLTSIVQDALFDQYYTSGTTAYVAGSYTEAASYLQDAVDSDPEGDNSKYYDALYYLGFAYFNAGDYDKADEIFNLFSEKYPDSASIVAPYIGGGTQNQSASTSISQGEASTDRSTDSSLAGTAGSSSTGTADTSAQSDITIYGDDNTSYGSGSVAWTDPTTGQGYDMYGNPVY